MTDSLQTVNKAIAGSIAVAITKFMVDNNIIIDTENPSGFTTALTYVLTVAIGGVIVYIWPANKPLKKGKK